MDNFVFISIVLTGFTVAFLHAAIPTHWLPFVAAARAQRWSNSKTLAVTGCAGAGHVLFTTAVGILIVWGGMALNSRIGNAFPFIAGGALIALGIFYFVRRKRGGCAHVHLLGHHDHEREQADASDWSQKKSDWAAITGLVALLTFSPCEAFLPVFLTGAKYGWIGFALLSGILAIATVAGMITFTSLTLLGLKKLKLHGLERFEPWIVSGVFCLLGLLVIIFEH